MTSIRVSSSVLFLISIALTVAASAQSVATLATGVTSWQPLVQGVDGNLYGADYAGGPGAYGSIFRIAPDGTLTTIHNFGNEAGGRLPTGLVLALNGNLYGTTKQGGSSGAPCPSPVAGCGTVFGFTSAGTLFTLHRFTGPDGMYPTGGLTIGSDGNFYGTTSGTNQKGATGAIYGTVFKITPDGTFTTLHTFNFTDGAYPSSPLVLGTDKRLYGTTSEGGAPGAGGTVFAITTSGTFTSLHSFTVAGGGANPAGPLVQAANGNFYGTTAAGGSGCNGDSGTIYYISPAGATFVTFYQFSKTCNSGSNPNSGLVLGNDGNFYGGASGSPVNADDAILFEITPKIHYTNLYTFGYMMSPFGDGVNLMQSTNGIFYGTTNPSTQNYPPEVFSLSTGLGPFITALPSIRGVGTKVLILGQGLTGATSVTFNGVSAQFTVNSDTEIATTVPAGATKGYVQVTTPSGTLTSKVIFHVG